MFKKIFLGSDHAGVPLKRLLLETIRDNKWLHDDVGTHQTELSVDYPDFVTPVVGGVLADPKACGILICNSGLGMSMAANRFPGIRAALCHEGLSAQLARQHNDANVLVLAGGLIGPHMARACLIEFMITGFEKGRHVSRLDKLEQLHKHA